jgi:hypothetical protein
VFPWTATGPHGEASGISEDREKAQQAAEEHLAAGRAVTALVEEAVAEVGAPVNGARQSGYRRTGEAWHAVAAGAGDAVSWVPAEAQAGTR